MKNEDVLQAFVMGRKGKSSNGNLISDGVELINYSTVIAKYQDEKILFNTKKYSVTTSRIQNQLRFMIPERLLQEVEASALN